MARAIRPRTYLLANLFRDQLDRYGELELLADRWAELVAEDAGRARFVLNADDPLVADLGRGRDGVVYFGVEDDSQALPALQHAADSKHCRNCGTPYAYEAVYLGHLGRYRCPNCGRERPQPEVAATRGRAQGHDRLAGGVAHPGGPLALELPLPGLYNVYNARGCGGPRTGARRGARDGGSGARGVRRLVRAGRDDPGRRTWTCRSCW